MFVNFNILNQLGSPAINSNTFANRPAAGQTGRLFVSTDTFEIYRDNGTTWDLIGGPGTSTITGTGTATQVAYFTSSQAIGSSANLYWDNTNTRLGIGTSTPGVRLDIHGTGNMLHINSTSATANALMSFQRTGTNVWRLGDQYNGGSNFFEIHNTALANNAIQIDAATNKSILTSIESYSTGLARGNYLDYTLSLPNGTTFTSPNTVTALGATLNLNIAGSATIPAGARSGADFFNGINFTSAGTFTVNQSSTIRAFSNVTAGWAFNGSAVGTVTHLAGLRVLFPTNSGSAINVTDNYALLINNQNANTGTITYTNRWGIYQEGASDLNYMAANLLLGSTVNTGDKLQVTGTTYLSSQLTVGNNTLYVDTVFNRVGISTAAVTNKLTVIDSQTGTQITTSPVSKFVNTGNAFSKFILGSDNANFDAVASMDNNATLANCKLRFYIGNGTGSTSGHSNDQFVITGNNRIGINTDAPTSKVDIYEAQTTSECYLSLRNNRSRNAAVRTQTTIGDYYIGTGIGTDLNRFMLYDATSGQYRFVVTDSGNFLIGTTTDAGYKLDVNGTSNFTGALTGTSATFSSTITNNVYTTPGSISNPFFNDVFLLGTTNTYSKIQWGNEFNSTYGTYLRFIVNGTSGFNTPVIALTLFPSGAATFSSSVQTGAPNTGTAAAWKLGSRVAATVVVNTTEYIEIDIGGTLYKLATVT